MKDKPTSMTRIEIPGPKIGRVFPTIKGTSPIIFHKWSDKAKRMILEKQMKKSVAKKEARNPAEELESSLYRNSKGEVAFPANCIKMSMVGACRSLDSPMTVVRAAVFVRGDEQGLIPVKYTKLTEREDMVRIGMGSADLRYRMQAEDWSMTFAIDFNFIVVNIIYWVKLYFSYNFFNLHFPFNNFGF